MFVYGWRLDEGRSLPGCAALWAWEPVMVQEELFCGMELAGPEGDEAGDGEDQAVRSFSR